MKEKYFIHLLDTPVGKYIYDVNTNSIIETREETFEYLKCGKKNTNQVDRDIQKMIKQGYLKTTRVEKAKNPCIDYIEDFLNNRVAYLVLQVTQGCNLRCEYCVYSGGYDTRTHTNKRMNYKTAIKAIDFLIEHSKDEDTLYLGFYGGEPLLEFELIKMCVKYINKNAFGKKVEFNITTNATLLI